MKSKGFARFTYQNALQKGSTGGGGLALFRRVAPGLSKPAKNLGLSHPREGAFLPGLPHRPLVSI